MGICSSNQGQDPSDDRPTTREERNDEEILEGKVNYVIGDKKFVEMKKWPVILQDTTGSMTLGTTLINPTPRCDTVREVVRIISTKLAKIDNADRQGTGVKGVPIVTFNDDEGGRYRGFIHPASVDAEWAGLEFGGRTHIMSGWHEVIRRYKSQFEDQPESAWPILLIMLITDGELMDSQEFEEHLKKIHGRAFVEIALIGFGEDHDKARAHYQRIASANPHVRMTPFDKVADADLIANQMISMIDPTLFIVAGANLIGQPIWPAAHPQVYMQGVQSAPVAPNTQAAPYIQSYVPPGYTQTAPTCAVTYTTSGVADAPPPSYN